MDFFERQEKARRNTKLMVFYFVTGVALLILVVYLAAAILFTTTGLHLLLHRHYNYYNAAPFEMSQQALWNPKLFFGVAIGTLAVIGIGSLFKTMELSQGGVAVSTMMGGRLISPNTTDLDERKLVNVVEEMALASGVPVPQVYVMDAEQGINAFAAGHTTSDASVTVTRGCMKLLTRDELQGVIAHEFSHILNGDMRLNLRLLGIIFGILCLAIIGRILLQTRGGNSRNKSALPLLGLALLLIGYVGVFFGHLIQAAVSRQREFLADASAVQFTRNPQGITGALKKIGGLGEMGSRVGAAHAQEVSHMFFGNGLATPLFGLLATHPPLAERIRAIDPAFDGKFPATRYAPEEESPYPPEKPFAPARHAGIPPIVPAAIAVQSVMPNLGTPNLAHLRYAVALRNSFSPALRNAARDAMGASALIYGLLISTEPVMRAKQLDLLAQNTSAAVRQETERLLPEMAPVAANAKLPLVDLALPGLRQLSPAQYQQFGQAIRALIEADGEIDLFEYVLQKIVLRHLDSQFNGARKVVLQYYALRPLASDCSVLLSALAHVGSDDAAQCEAAFRQGANNLSYYAQAPLVYVASDQCDLPQVDTALERLNQAVLQIKKNVLNACVQVVAADGVIQEMEAELLRAVADALDCPMPPFLQPANEGISVGA
jgi:Zn-dependent protease with chaperone function